MTKQSIFSEKVLLQRFHHLKMNIDVLKRIYIHSDHVSPSRKFTMYQKILHLKKEADYVQLNLQKRKIG
jgi:hypothetical protein